MTMNIITWKICLEAAGQSWACTSALGASFVKRCQRANKKIAQLDPQVLVLLEFSLHGIFNGVEEKLPVRKVRLKDNMKLRGTVPSCEASLREVPQGWRV